MTEAKPWADDDRKKRWFTFAGFFPSDDSPSEEPDLDDSPSEEPDDSLSDELTGEGVLFGLAAAAGLPSGLAAAGLPAGRPAATDSSDEEPLSEDEELAADAPSFDADGLIAAPNVLAAAGFHAGFATGFPARLPVGPPFLLPGASDSSDDDPLSEDEELSVDAPFDGIDGAVFDTDAPGARAGFAGPVVWEGEAKA